MGKKRLSTTQLEMLQELWDAERLHGGMAWIRARMILSNRTLESLEDREFIEGELDGDDVYILLTAEGKRALIQGRSRLNAGS